MTKLSEVRTISKSSARLTSGDSSKTSMILPLQKLKTHIFEKSEGENLAGQTLHRRLNRVFTQREFMVKSGP